MGAWQRGMRREQIKMKREKRKVKRELRAGLEGCLYVFLSTPFGCGARWFT
jgi:hypothetical protein